MRMRPCRGNRYRVRVRPGAADAEPVRVLTSPGGAETVRVTAVCASRASPRAGGVKACYIITVTFV